MSDKITSKNGKYEGVLQETDGNFVVYRSADGKPIAALGTEVPDAIEPTPPPDDEYEHTFDPMPLPLPPETNRRKFFIVAVILLIGVPLLGILVGAFVF